MRFLTIAVDFDGTIVEHKFPGIGNEFPMAIDTLKWIQGRGHSIILFTCRENELDGNYLAEAVKWLKDRGVIVDAVNENTAYYKQLGFTCRKPYWDLLIDDTAGFDPMKWDHVSPVILELEEQLSLLNYRCE